MPRKDRPASAAPSKTYGRDEMAAIFKRCGIDLLPAQIRQLWTYHQLLRQHNPELNLTRIHNFANMVLKLYVDSILPGQLVALPSPLMDLGTGPGMPGIPLKIAYPALEILLAESRQKRVGFLETVTEQLKLEGLRIIGRGITPQSEYPVQGVITRAVENMALTLERVRGCLAQGGLAVFMKGPQCDEEIRDAGERLARHYALAEDRSYRIPHTEHHRRLVVFQRLDAPLWALRAAAMERDMYKKIESEQNEIFKDLKKLLTGRGIKKQGRALVSGSKIVSEVLRDFPELCEAWITGTEELSPPPGSPEHLRWYHLAPGLFQTLDTLGTDAPLLLIRTPDVPDWDPATGLPEGCSVLVPFQDPENVGAIARSAAAFGADRIILLAESANPYHPKALRASGGAVLRIRLLHGPALDDLPANLPIVPLSAEGPDIGSFSFPPTFGLLPGMEGPGLSDHWKARAVAIPMQPGVESLNAATATAIALYVWSRSRATAKPEKEKNF